MDRIVFEKVVPHVFRNADNMISEVWNNEIMFEKNHLYLVEAASGKGKSTFCSYIIGYRHDYEGTILFDDVNVSTFRKSKWTGIRQVSISYLFQELRLFPELTAFENVQIKNRLTGFKSKSEIELWFDRLGIRDKMHDKVDVMSYGQQQRVALMRALVQPFDFILLDEPISHLDDDNAAIMGDLLMEEAHKQEAGVIITSIGKHMCLDYEKIFKL